MDSTGGCPESLEKLFQQLELESERRAKAEPRVRDDPSSSEVKTMGLRQEPSDSSLRTKRTRRRGSVSITRFGQLHDDYSSKATSPAASSKRLSAIMPEREPPFYQTPIGSDSNASIASGASTDASDEHHVTQMQQIMPRQNTISRAVGGIIPRRLSRARSERVMGPQDTNLVIGVSVSEATVEATAEEEADMDSRIVVQRTLRSQPSRLSMAETTPASSGWVNKAKNFTSKFRRKSSAGIPTLETSLS
ncbi:hypothetical protein BD626DRAFT_472726 [Schizophyllum amplum]|uniref:Uncharacterized protein n=1 Tax=Schizophyllum amplum TaxID=97359 RepID=A0A550CW69_9AGAR|nr:hypothetical protein BD626DRAFT_472726 [Auriculariopsis ampla]